MAVPLTVDEDFLNQAFIKSVVRKSQLNLIIFNVETEKIVLWFPLHSIASISKHC
ncbi:MAG: hypothetical protein EBE86_021445 [Hormoscilla sp. GUM202]|nr:hypothetical protein [Hormoscilla sp. GUM202]